MQRSSAAGTGSAKAAAAAAAAAAASATVPAFAAMPVLQLRTVPQQPAFQSAQPATAILLHDVQSMQQTLVPVHIGNGTDGEQTETDKQAIYRHPLFPLLASLFEKCEKATANIDSQVTNESFNVDIENFVRGQEADHKPFFSDNAEVDDLMVKAIQVLRIHLLELEKLSELCKDFSTRYISCLRGKISGGSLLRSDSTSSDTEDSVEPPPAFSAAASLRDSSSVAPRSFSPTSAAAAAVCLGSAGQLMSGGTVYQMVQTSQGLVAQPLQLQTAPTILQGSGAAMQLTHFSLASPSNNGSAAKSSPLVAGGLTAEQQSLALASLAAMDDDDDDDEMNVSHSIVAGGGSGGIGGNSGGRGGKAKRGVLPKQATLVMKSWLFQHIVHPYPTEDEKRQIASQTNLTLLQVNNWFINARRRILQPMLDATNPEQARSKKNKSHGSASAGRPMQRFWPESMASLQQAGRSHVAGSSAVGGASSAVPDQTASLHMLSSS